MARDRSSRPEAKPLRLFVAVDVPEPVKAGLLQAVEPVRSAVPGARWTRPEGWHVTLKFLGSTWPRLVADVEAAVRTVAAAAAPFESWLTTVGAFPSRGRARVLWVGLEDGGGAFASIVKHLDESLSAIVAPEKRAFTPHLTLARIAPALRLPDAAAGVLSLDVGSGAFVVDRLVLYRSHLSPKGASYQPLLCAPLGAGDA